MFNNVIVFNVVFTVVFTAVFSADQDDGEKALLVNSTQGTITPPLSGVTCCVLPPSNKEVGMRKGALPENGCVRLWDL